jgi:hypothetical protein
MMDIFTLQARETATRKAHTLENTVQFRGLLPLFASIRIAAGLCFSLVIHYAQAVTASKAASGNSFST